MNFLTVLVSAVLIAAISAAAIHEERLDRREPKVGSHPHQSPSEQTEEKLQAAIETLLDTVDALFVETEKNTSTNGTVDIDTHPLTSNLTKVIKSLRRIEHSFDLKGQRVIQEVEKNLTKIVRILPHVISNVTVVEEKTAIKVIITHLDYAITKLEGIQNDVIISNETQSNGVHDHHGFSTKSSAPSTTAETTDTSEPTETTDTSAPSETTDDTTTDAATTTDSEVTDTTTAASESTDTSAATDSTDTSTPSDSTDSASSESSDSGSTPESSESGGTSDSSSSTESSEPSDTTESSASSTSS